MQSFAEATSATQTGPEEIHRGLADLAAAESRLAELTVAPPLPETAPPLPAPTTAPAAETAAPADETRESAADEPEADEPETETADPHRRDAQGLKTKMIRASRARRRQRRDSAGKTVDPILPDWYEPSTETPVEEPALAGRSADR